MANVSPTEFKRLTGMVLVDDDKNGTFDRVKLPSNKSISVDQGMAIYETKRKIELTHLPKIPADLLAQRDALFQSLSTRLSAEVLADVRKIFDASAVIGQGNPKLSKHPITKEECLSTLAAQPLQPADPECGAPNMVRLSNGVCIDQFEYPNMACEFPVVLATAKEASELCEAEGKRLCDAHEWEGACAGEVKDPATEYAFGRDRANMAAAHNNAREKVWAYGPDKDHDKCATDSTKTDGCTGGYKGCGSNTYPAGSFPECVSEDGVYDQHGNAAEHMNMPMKPSEMTSEGGSGSTEMKGSWFIFKKYEAHPDDCRWRAPNWHGTKVTSPASHANYHLGFRCCDTPEPVVAEAPVESHYDEAAGICE